MKITLYTGNNCHQCKEVIDFLNDKKINFQEINIDENKNKPPIPLFVFPALFINDQLKAYGVDIVNRWDNF